MPRRRSKLSPPSEDDAELHSPSGDPSALARKITIPDRVPGYVHRPDLIDRALPTRRWVTVLRATGGFGKTVLLAECCRHVSDDGVPTAWVSLDEHDTAAVLERYIAAAFVQAGLSIRGVLEAHDFAGLEGRIGVLIRAIQSQRGPFVLAFDELERRTDTSSISLLAFVLQRGPPNLHLAFAGRRVPDGLNLAGWVFDGHAELLEADDVRFSRADISGFFDLGLSQRALSEEAERSAGWPVALRIARNGRQQGTNGDVDPHPLVASWIESRLFELFVDPALFGTPETEHMATIHRRGTGAESGYAPTLPEGHLFVGFDGEMAKAPLGVRRERAQVPDGLDWVGATSVVGTLAAQTAEYGRQWSLGWIRLAAGARQGDLVPVLTIAGAAIVVNCRVLDAGELRIRMSNVSHVRLRFPPSAPGPAQGDRGRGESETHRQQGLQPMGSEARRSWS